MIHKVACFAKCVFCCEGDSLSVSVSLKSTATNAVFVIDITDITVFDCRIHRK